MASRSAEEELEALHDQSTAWLQRLLLDYFGAIYEGDLDEQARLEEVLADAYATTMAFADLLGRRRVMREAREVMLREYYPEGLAEEQASERQFFAAAVPNVPFAEALDDMLAREPMLASDYREVQQQYRDYHAFAAVKSTSQAMTAKVQQIVADSIGRGTPDPAAAIQEATGWTRAYADTVYKTNVATAYSAGRLRQAADPDVQDVIVGLRFTAVGDSSTRKNHKAADGVIAAQDDPIWMDLAPPLGYNCRCGLELVDRFSAEGMLGPDGKLPRARMPAGAGRDRGFVAIRPDKAFSPAGFTTKTRMPNPDAVPSGEPKVVRGNSSNKRSLRRENEIAVALSRAGYDLLQLPDIPGEKSPDYLIGMHVYDAYAPTTNSIESIVREIRRKASERKPRTVLFLDDIEGIGDRSAFLRQLKIELSKNGGGCDGVLTVSYKSDKIVDELWTRV